MQEKTANSLRSLVAWTGTLICLAYVGSHAQKPPTVAPFVSSVQGLVAASVTSPGGIDQDAAEEDIPIYVSGLENGWQDWSWANHRIPDERIKAGDKPAFRFEPSQWKGLYLHHDSLGTRGYAALRFMVQGGKSGGQKVAVCLADGGGKFGKKVLLADYMPGHRIPAGKFVTCTVPLDAMDGRNTQITGVCFQDASGGTQAPIYLANIRLIPPGQPEAGFNVALHVDTTHAGHDISPLIYGMATEIDMAPLHLPLSRWGGNSNTRYNWEKGNCWNAARDYYFRNGNYNNTSAEARKPSGVADTEIAAAKKAHCAFLLTIPTIGWVARDDNQNNASVGVPNQGGPPLAPGSEAITGYNPTANRKKVSVHSLPRKGRPFTDPPDLNDNVVYQDEWISHLVRHFGKASAGGVRFYAMDNEPDIWDVTHTDMHPVRAGYNEILKRFLDYATAVKDVDPSAKITGPVSWGWTGYFFSALDRGNDNFATHADRNVHGGMPLVPWFLQQVAAHDRKTGRRTLDYLDVHFYPQAPNVYGQASDPSTNALRLRSTRSLWDPNYKDESWINTPIQLLPRLRQWVDKYYPGTRVALNEWNWGADGTLNGALAIAEVLGVLGRERADMACYWASPMPGTPGFFAYKMYLNADDAFHGFGNREVSATSSLPYWVSCFGSVDTHTGAPVLMLINKRTKGRAVANLDVRSGKAVTSAQVFRYSGADLKKIARLSDMRVSGGQCRLMLPPASITLLRCR